MKSKLFAGHADNPEELSDAVKESRLMKSIRSDMKALRDAGLVDDETMRELDGCSADSFSGTKSTADVIH